MQIPRRLLPPIQDLHAFEAAARTGSISEAARELDLTQSAVSRQVKGLEAQLGVALFVREKQTIRLTPAGQGYAREIREVLRRISIAGLSIRAAPLGGTLNLGVLPTLGARWLAPRLPGFGTAQPGINLNLFTRASPFEFDQDSLDAAIHFGPPTWPGAELTPLFAEEVLAVGAPDLVARYQFKRPSDVRQAPLLILMSRPDAWEKWLAAQKMAAAGIHGTMFDTFEMIIRAAMAGVGLALLPSFLITEELADRRLVPALKKALKSEAQYYLACPPARANYAPLKAFRDWLVAEAALRRR